MTLRFAILGAARIAKPALIDPVAAHEGAEIVAVGASDVARARDFAATHAIPHAGDYEAAIARPDVDVVYIALPPAAHAPWTLKALAAGKHVFLEKPAVTTPAEAEAIVAAADAAGLRLIEAFHYRWHPLFLRALEIARAGVLGALVRAEAEFSAPIPQDPREFRWRADLGGGALADLGCYTVSWMRHLIGAEPDVVEAAQDLAPDGADIRTRATLAFPGGPTAAILTDMAPADGRRTAHARLEGERGSLTLVNPLAPQMGAELILNVDGTETRETFTRRPTFAFQLDGVVDAIVNGMPVPVEGADILGNARTMHAIRERAARP
jgi:predicted dehydrogenase